MSSPIKPWQPKVNPLDFCFGYRFCTYDLQGRVVSHTCSRAQAINSPEPWAYDYDNKRWIKRPQ